MDAWEKADRAGLGECNLWCIARQNVRGLIALINSPIGYRLASNTFTKYSGQTLFDKVFSGEYPEYNEFSPALKKVLDYIKSGSYNPNKLIEIANEFPGTYFYDLVHNLE